MRTLVVAGALVVVVFLNGFTAAKDTKCGVYGWNLSSDMKYSRDRGKSSDTDFPKFHARHSETIT